MHKKYALIITLIYSALLAFVSLIRLNNLPDVGITFGDKIYHFLAYTILVLLWFGSFLSSFKLKKTQAIIYAVILSVIFGIIIEVLQETITDYRDLDVYDVLANTFGAITAAIVLWFKNSSHVKN